MERRRPAFLALLSILLAACSSSRPPGHPPGGPRGSATLLRAAALLRERGSAEDAVRRWPRAKELPAPYEELEWAALETAEDGGVVERWLVRDPSTGRFWSVAFRDASAPPELRGPVTLGPDLVGRSR